MDGVIMLYGPGYNPWLRNATDGERSEDIFRIWTESHGPNTECNISFPILSRFAVKIRGLSLILAHSSPANTMYTRHTRNIHKKTFSS